MIKKDIVAEAPRQMVVRTPIVTQEVTGGSGVSVTNSKSSTVNCKDTYAVDSPSILFKGAIIAEGPIQAKMFISQGGFTVSPIGSYNKATTSPKSGTAKNPANTPNNLGIDESNRHCAAWEEVNDAFIHVAAQIDKLAECTGCPVSGAPATVLSKKSKMKKNRGE
jgi:hypothetical protein